MASVPVEQTKQHYLQMSIEQKRREYKCGDQFVTLDKIPTWAEDATNVEQSGIVTKKPVDKELNNVISLFRGDLTALEIDCIVNSANARLAGGGGVDGAIHSAAGADLLQAECRTLNGCQTGQAKLTGGYRLPARYVCHTVGPIGEKSSALEQCYINSLDLAAKNQLRSIAFPCISTGLYGYPNESAGHVALNTVRNWLEKNRGQMDRVIFCVFLQKDLDVYRQLLPVYFPK